jgi:hypothetical protein
MTGVPKPEPDHRILREQPAPNPLLLTSALSYILPIYVAQQLDKILFARTMQAILLSSLWYHSTYSRPAFVVDQISIVLGELVGLYTTYNTSNIGLLLWFFTNVYVGFLYTYGKRTRTLAFDPDMYSQSWFHASIHITTALAFTVILYTDPHLNIIAPISP